MTTLHIVPVGPVPNEWYWLEDGCRCGGDSRWFVDNRGIDTGRALVYRCGRCRVLLATIYDDHTGPWPDKAFADMQRLEELRHTAAYAVEGPVHRTNPHRGYRCRSDGRRYRLDAIAAWFKSVWTGHDDWP